MPIRSANAFKFALLTGAAIVSAACVSPGYTPAEQEIADTMGASEYQPRTQLEREAIETQDMFAQAAFWSREYDLNPGDLEAAIKLSSTLRKLGNPAQALEIAKTARALYPRNTDLLAEYAAGLVALEMGKDAIAPLSKAVRSNPQNARLWSLMGASYDQIGQFSKGREFYGRALSIAPNDSNVLANVGLSYALEGDAQTAEIWLRRAAQMPGASAHVRQNLALVLGLQGKFDEAETLAREDLNAGGAENNLAYLKAMRGGGRTYEALKEPQAKPSSPTPAIASRAMKSAPAKNWTGSARTSFQPRTYGAPVQNPAQRQVRSTSQLAGGAAPQSRPPVSAIPQTAPNISGQGGAREAAMAAAKRMQQRGGPVRTQTVTPDQIRAQQDVLSRIGQSVSAKSAPAPARPTYAQMQTQANAQAQAQAQARMQNQRAQTPPNPYATPQAYPQNAPAQYGSQPQNYRPPARRRD